MAVFPCKRDVTPGAVTCGTMRCHARGDDLHNSDFVTLGAVTYGSDFAPA